MRSDYDITNLMYGADTAAELDIYRGEPKPALNPCFWTLSCTVGLLCPIAGLRRAEMEFKVNSYEDYTEDTFSIWLIDHGKLQAHLQNLKNLKLLVIRGDTYPPRANEVFGHPSYYRSSFANQEYFQTAKDHPELASFVEGNNEPTLAWKHAHLYRMLEYKELPKGVAKA
ncbi:hypothetical protein FACUT_6279 [Fusarium acutatum]|uniref:Uncharacterized protein n=1 Tax=Fusarium acutatum TaxID=78861 RepID=A0A8H4JSB6_9HYPO|nr:hypothetical protein FACUT_6279 [Fusarium acutatum]